MTIRHFSVEYDPIDSSNVFSNGDVINGRVVLEVSKEVEVQELVFRAEGWARVLWHEYYGESAQWVYTAKEKYYNISQPILTKTRPEEVICPGRHVFPFSFKIPDKKMPSTFRSSSGKIVHKLKAELKLSMHLTKTAKTHFTFVSGADADIPGLMAPQSGSTDKTISTFGSGTVGIELHAERMGYSPGEALQVTTEINNQTTRAVRPKFVLYKKKSYFAQGNRKVTTSDIVKEKCEPVESGCKETLTKAIVVPKDVAPSVLNCKVIKLEYRLKVVLDIKHASNPEVKLPVVVLSERSVTAAAQSEKSKASEALTENSPFNIRHYPPVQISASENSSDPPPYGAYAMYPSYSPPDQSKGQS